MKNERKPCESFYWVIVFILWLNTWARYGSTKSFKHVTLILVKFVYIIKMILLGCYPTYVCVPKFLITIFCLFNNL